MVFKLETEIVRLNDVLSLAGFNMATGKYNIRVFIYVLFTSSVIFNNSLYVYFNWNDMDKRVIGLKSISNCILLSSHLLVPLLNWKNMIVSLRIIESKTFPFPYKVSQERHEVSEATRSRMARLSYIWYHAIIINVGLGCVVPIISFIKALFYENIRDITPKELILILPFYYPPGYETLLMFFIAYVLQNWFHVVGCHYGYYGVINSFLSMQTIVGELRLLRLSVEEMELQVLRKQQLPDEKYTDDDLNYHFIYANNINTLSMKCFLRYFVKHHQDIYRKVSDINKAIQWFAFISNSGVSIYLCLGIFYIVKGTELSGKIQEIGICGLWLYDIYCHDFYGEMIQTEDNNLRNALYSCNWTGKPEWLKKSFQIILIRMTKQIEMRPIGLFVLCLKNFALCMNAAYSYYNLLNRFG